MNDNTEIQKDSVESHYDKFYKEVKFNTLLNITMQIYFYD